VRIRHAIDLDLKPRLSQRICGQVPKRGGVEPVCAGERRDQMLAPPVVRGGAEPVLVRVAVVH
jgi:hypothetical protein